MEPDAKIDSLLDLLRRRTSCRDYREDPVPDELISKCIEAARLAPSACNKQPWRFVIVKDPDLREKICENGLLPGVPMPWMRSAPVITALCVEKSLLTHSIAPMLSGIDYSLIDIGIAGEHFVLAAEALGLGSCWIGWFKPKYIKKLLNIPSGMKALSLISLGYPAKISEPSSRLAPDEIMRVDKWGK